MGRYIDADIKRLMNRVPRWILLGLCIVVSVIILVALKQTSDKPMLGVDYENTLESVIGVCAIIIGLFELEFIFGDDFKAKTFQVAIGSGISRRRIINTKWAVVMAVIGFDILLLSLILLILGFFIPTDFSIRLILKVFVFAICMWLMVVSSTAVCMIVFFGLQKIGLGILLYLAIQFGLVSKILMVIGAILHIEKFHIQSYELIELNNVFLARLELGNFSIASFIGIIIYMVASFWLADIVFKRRELEF